MKKFHALIIIVGSIASCKTQGDSNRDYDKYDPDKIYKLQLNPSPGSAYHYEISNETKVNMEVGGQEIDNINRSVVNLNYKINKDSAGNLLFATQFDKIQIYTKNKDAEKEINAANAALSSDPIEKMLGILKETILVSTISPKGETKAISGYNEIGEKIIATFPATDANTKFAIETEWEKAIGQSLIKKNLDQLFKIFPDSVVHLGDTWKLALKQEGQFNMIIKNIFKLKAINNDIAVIESHGTIINENPSANQLGIGGGTVSDVKGEQQGEYEMETKTGMLISAKIKANVTGSIQVMGQVIPFTIKTSAKVNGRKVK